MFTSSLVFMTINRPIFIIIFQSFFSVIIIILFISFKYYLSIINIDLFASFPINLIIFSVFRYIIRIFQTFFNILMTINRPIFMIIFLSFFSFIIIILFISFKYSIPSDIDYYSDSVLEVYKKISIRKNITNNSRFDLKVGLGCDSSYIYQQKKVMI